jgi:hypothetical protein
MSGSENSDIEDEFENGNYGEEFNDFDEDYFYEEQRSSSPVPEDNTPDCIYCGRSVFHTPHTCGAAEGCKDKNNLLIKDCKCKWHKQLKKLID